MSTRVTVISLLASFGLLWAPGAHARPCKGLKTELEREQAKGITNYQAIEILKAFKEADLPPSSSSLQKEDPRHLAIIEKVLGVRRSGTNFYLTARKLFGSWENALKAAGVDTPPVTKEQIVLAIKAMEEAQLRPNLRAVKTDKDGVYTRAIQQKHGFTFNSLSVYTYALKFFGSWDEALRAAGIDPLIARKKGSLGKIKTKEDLLRGIKALAKDKLLRGTDRIRKDADGTRAAVLRKVYGVKLSSFRFYLKAVELFGSWKAALEAAGIKHAESIESIPAGLLSSKEQILKGVFALKKMKGIDLNEAAMLADRGNRRGRALEDVYDYPVSGKFLYEKARKIFGSWDDALRAAGIDPAEVRKLAPQGILASEEQVIKGILAIHKASINPNSNRLRNDSGGRVAQELRTAFGTPVSPRTLMENAVEIFGSWDGALEAAGLDPDRIRLRAVFYLGGYRDAAEMQGNNAAIRLSEETKTPEQIQIEKADLSLISKAADELSPKDQALGSRIIEIAIDSDEDIQSPEQLTNIVSKELGPSVPVETIQRVIDGLSRTDALRDLLGK